MVENEKDYNDVLAMEQQYGNMQSQTNEFFTITLYLRGYATLCRLLQYILHLIQYDCWKWEEEKGLQRSI